MLDWWNSLTMVQQVLATCAIPATLILIIQTILLLFGLGGNSDADGADFSDGTADFDDADIDFNDGGFVHEGHVFGEDSAPIDPQDVSGLRILTVRGFVAFFAVGGWMGVALIDFGVIPALSVLIGVISGLLAMTLLAYLFKWAMKLQEQGNLDISNSVGKMATVYLTIPANMTGCGKVTVTFQDRFMEMEAMTRNRTDIKTGSSVKVTEVSANNVLIVETI